MIAVAVLLLISSGSDAVVLTARVRAAARMPTAGIPVTAAPLSGPVTAHAQRPENVAVEVPAATPGSSDVDPLEGIQVEFLEPASSAFPFPFVIHLSDFENAALAGHVIIQVLPDPLRSVL